MSDSQGPAVRFNKPERDQSEWRLFSLQTFLPEDHRARIVWRYVQSLDLSSLDAKYKAVQGVQGRNAVDPRILLALWIYATTESVSSAREIDRKCGTDLAYMWICGGVSVNYHLLSDFRSENAELLQRLLVSTVASLLSSGVIDLETVAQDGMRTRANAGSSSFRRKPKLQACVDAAKAHVERMAAQSEQETASKAQQSARERAAREKLQRAEEALRQVMELEKEKEARKKGSGEHARCSLTDPEARKMKMADGGFRPGYNVQIATDAKSRMIVGVSVTNSGNDGEQMAPMQNQIREYFGVAPKNILVDCGFPSIEQITAVERNGSRVHAPIHSKAAMEKRGKDPFERQRRDSDESFQFRQRMSTPEARELYKRRPSIVEYCNAEFRNRGLIQFRVRGLQKVLASTLLYALTFNFMRVVSLKAMT